MAEQFGGAHIKGIAKDDDFSEPFRSYFLNIRAGQISNTAQVSITSHVSGSQILRHFRCRHIEVGSECRWKERPERERETSLMN